MYTYKNLIDDIEILHSCGAKTGSIGTSLLGNEIYYVHTGISEGNQLIITGGIHARENVTTQLVIKQAYRHLRLPMGIYFVPMLNPDGALLIERGSAVAGEYAALLLEINGSEDFSQWKANARAVDLNNNFDARFGTGKSNVTHPASHGYVGEHPFSEPETAALRDFTLAVKPYYTVSYHALGREVYWDFGQKSDKDRAMAQSIANMLGYDCVDGDLGSAGGYKDWCILQGIPGVTIEIGSSWLSHPLSARDITDDVCVNIDLPSEIARQYPKIYGVE
ncbi:MAG: hypothetical protein IKC48_02955 [Clostridia bacterium]|nr:hypothetical protein [Clostridia bacterium]